MITIIDYGAGNIQSIQNMLKKLGVESELSNTPSQISKASKLILPGVGHFDHGMRNLTSSGLIDVLNQKVLVEKTPILGICLGSQMLGNGSEEGVEKGLGWLDLDNVKFDKSKLDRKMKIPHMGWNYVSALNNKSLFKKTNPDTRFYFVHSYHMLPKRSEDILANTEYGYKFASAVQNENIFGVQFHPEKSHKYGKQLLANFSEI